jgi:hypothetical protein
VITGQVPHGIVAPHGASACDVSTCQPLVHRLNELDPELVVHGDSLPATFAEHNGVATDGA